VVVYALSFNYVCMCACDARRYNTHVLGSFKVQIVFLKFSTMGSYGIPRFCFILVIFLNRLSKEKFT
jgi:hypothetical protein